MGLKIDRYQSRPVWPKRYAAALKKGVAVGALTEQEALQDRGDMNRVLRNRRRLR